jgi:hypothetical protein
MRTHQAQNRFNGTVLLRKFTTIRHNSTSRTSIALPGRGDPWVWSLFSEKIIDSRQTVDQITANATRKGRHKLQMYQSQFLGSSIALESFSITAKIFARRPCSPSRDGGSQIGKCGRTSSFDSPVLFLVIIKLCAPQAPYPRTNSSSTQLGLCRGSGLSD